MGRAKRKRAFGHMQTAKAQISLHIRAIWSGISLSSERIGGYYSSMESNFAHAQDDVNPHILRMFEGTFSLDSAHILAIFWYCFRLSRSLMKSGTSEITINKSISHKHNLSIFFLFSLSKSIFLTQYRETEKNIVQELINKSPAWFITHNAPVLANIERGPNEIIDSIDTSVHRQKVSVQLSVHRYFRSIGCHYGQT